MARHTFTLLERINTEGGVYEVRSPSGTYDGQADIETFHKSRGGETWAAWALDYLKHNPGRRPEPKVR